MQMKLPEDYHRFSRTVSIQAGRIMLERITELLKSNNDFSFETTLATKSYVSLIKKAKALNFKVILIYFWLESIELAKARVKKRVEQGGHNIPDEVIERRYKRGLYNFSNLYKPICDSWMLYDNSRDTPVIIATGDSSLASYVYNQDIWEHIKSNP
jgi:predicted ABC-type ATPase